MDTKQIHDVVVTNIAAVSAGDLKAILATFEPDAVMVNPEGGQDQGQTKLRDAFQQFLAINPQIEMTGHSIHQAEDLALHTSSWIMHGQTPDGHKIEQSGMSVVVLRKQSNGQWLMVIDHPFADKLLQA